MCGLCHRGTVSLPLPSVIGDNPETIPELCPATAWETPCVIGAAPAQLLERGEELDEIDACLDAARSTRGRLLIIDGPPGIGKTSLIDAARRGASAAGFRVLRARGGQLEQGFALGVVRQLFEPLMVAAGDDDRQRWSAGAAAIAARVVDPRHPEVETVPEVSYRLLHALYWLLANLADDGPLALIIDDAHWADPPSVRFLSFLAPRVEELPLAVVLGSRPERPEIAGLLLDPLARVLRPGRLSQDAVAGWLDSALGQPPALGFAQACRHATGGNPFLLRELVREISAERISPDAACAERVGSLSPRGVQTSVLLRLAGLPPPAMALARSVAVLEQAGLEEAAAVAGVDVASAGPAVADLVGADVLEAGSVLTFVHPVVRAAVYRDQPAAERAAAHGRAALLLTERGSSADRVAAHLLLAPTGASFAVDVLRDAAGAATALGAPTMAAAYLERALAETAEIGPERIDLLIELGCAELAGDLPEAVRHLHQAVALAQDPSQLTITAVALARGLRYGGRGSEAVDVLEHVATRVDPADRELVQSLDLELLGCTATSAAARLRLTDWRTERLIEPQHPARTAWEHLSIATLALDAALSAQPAHRVEDLAARAVAGIQVLSDARLRGQVSSMAGLAYLLVDRFDHAASLFDELVETTSQLVLAGTHSGMLAQRASLHLRCGRLAQASADATRALELGREVQGARTLLPRAASVLVSVAAEQGTTPAPRILTADIDPDSLVSRLLVHSRAELLLAQDQLGAAVAQLLAYGERNRVLGWDGPATPWRSQAALALARLGERDRAHELVSEELEVAGRQASARSIGVALRAAGLLGDGDQRIRLLSQAVDVLDDSGAVLEHARALVSLGIERRHRGATASARDLLRQGHDLALRCHATRLVGLAQTELRLAGARPRRTALTGPESLTPGERRVVDLVAGGLSNRQVAQSLFVTEKTVETHLGHAYAKLGIRSRRGLAAVIASALAD